MKNSVRQMNKTVLCNENYKQWMKFKILWAQKRSLQLSMGGGDYGRLLGKQITFELDPKGYLELF